MYSDKIVFDIFMPKHGNPYTTDKVAEIKGMSSAEVLEGETTHLDGGNRTKFMTKLGLDTSIAAQSFLRRAFDAAKQAK